MLEDVNRTLRRCSGRNGLVAQGETFFLPELVEGVLAALVDNSARHLRHG